MANLIITIISIALVAVAAIMGAWYGGSAFLQGQAKAQANAIITDLKQVAGAAHLYFTTELGGVTIFPGGAYNTVVNNYLVPNYLQSSINKPMYGINNVLLYAFNKTTGQIAGGPNAFAVNVAAIYVEEFFQDARKGISACEQFVNVLGANQAGYVYRTPPGYGLTIPPADISAGKRWFCVFKDEDSSSTLNSGDNTFYFYYMFL